MRMFIFKIQKFIMSLLVSCKGLSTDDAWRKVFGATPSDFELCVFYDVTFYPDSERPGKFFVATTVGSVANNVGMDVYIPLADSVKEAMELAVSRLGLRELYNQGFGCYA